jgi:hypothetical protein
MPFIDYNSLKNKYPGGQMSENIRRLKQFDVFHCLLNGSSERANAVKKRVSGLPADFLKWLEVCDGGMLFDTSMLTTKGHDTELDLPFETYASYHNSELRKEKGISENWFVFAVAVHSDVFFFDMNKKDGKVYQWDIEEQKIYATWPAFEDWLTDQINEALSLIAEEQLDPLDIKLELGSNG